MGRPPCGTKEGLKRGAWSSMEDKILTDYVTFHGEGKWGKLPQKAGLKRCGKSCRQRWLNYLRPDIRRGDISQEEEDLIVRLHKLLGNRWALIAGRLPGRTDNEVKNYWNSTLKKRLVHTGDQSTRIDQDSTEGNSSSELMKTKPVTGRSPPAGHQPNDVVIQTKAFDQYAYKVETSCLPANDNQITTAKNSVISYPNDHDQKESSATSDQSLLDPQNYSLLQHIADDDRDHQHYFPFTGHDHHDDHDQAAKLDHDLINIDEEIIKSRMWSPDHIYRNEYLGLDLNAISCFLNSESGEGF